MRSLFVSAKARVALRALVPAAVITICAFVVTDHVTADVLAALPDQLRGIEAWQWVAAAVLTIASFLSVAQYDFLAHRAIGTETTARRARISGAASIALGQTLGLGVITGAIARWRLLPELSVTRAGHLSAFVSLTFVVSWGAVTAVACLVLPAPLWTFWPSVAAVLALPVLGMALFWWPTLRLRGRSIALPSLPLAGAFLFYACLDLVLAAGALFVLLPPEAIGIVQFLPLFFIALGCGLMSNTPGGVGPFELVLLTALPLTDPAPLLAAILAYRIVYYAVPATLAAAVLLRPLAEHVQPSADIPAPRRIAPRSEIGAVLQNGGSLARSGASTLAFWPTGQTMTAFADPVTGTPTEALTHLQMAARAAGTVPFIYKCGPRVAHAARNAGWSLLHIADEAVIDTATYTPDIPSRRTLRRKLRSAAKAGLHLRFGQPLPLAAMARVDAEWQSRKNGARGGSMGRFCENYIRHQWVVCAYINGTLVAFATAHCANDEWCLDIMRQSDAAPDGTMHALVDAMIRAARRVGAGKVSLAATPACPDPSNGLWRWIARQVSARSGGPGLRQFKSSFAPRWVPRYAAARHPGALALALCDVARAILSPAPPTPHNTNSAHDLDENYEVASSRAA
ncbi:phosphatidylglycerol lysyltransferase domain-containing protein [uncultured Tateyamaria sp.]|uniref:phosphatidylglycerol lysyltransferase domain-containing protein n=1 Tax=uncultured Tateyamaria sp. TaxID=455651 RepID=UPI00260B4B11|nr:phosphatidylglycerol lysyltransferase domain-containing protein [uncultured Tateyamaria sp.]